MLQTIDDRPKVFNQIIDGSSPSPSSYISTEVAIESYIKANCNIHLAAERLHVPITLLMDVLTQDHVALQRLLRTRLLLNIFSTFETAQTHLATAIPLMEGEDIAKTFIGLSQVLEKLTANATNVNINIHEYMMRMLPPEAREAFNILTAPEPSVIKLSSDDED